MKRFGRVHFLYLLAIAIGTGIYAFGFVAFNMANHLAQGGVAGLSLISYALWHIDPSYVQLLINIPLLMIGYRFLGRRTFIYTIWGIVSLAVWIWIFQRVSFTINISVGRMLFIFDSCILALSLSYVDLKHMMYTLIASFISMQMINLIQNGGYTVRGMLIITNHHVEVAKTIIEEIGRSATYLHGEGAYSGTEKEVLYVVLNPSEIQEVKQILSVIDPNAFASVINVHEVVGDFSPKRGRFKDLKK